MLLLVSVLVSVSVSAFLAVSVLLPSVFGLSPMRIRPLRACLRTYGSKVGIAHISCTPSTLILLFETPYQLVVTYFNHKSASAKIQKCRSTKNPGSLVN